MESRISIPVRDAWFDDVGSQDVHHHVELQGVGEEDGETEHAERHLSQGGLAGQVESDGRLGGAIKAQKI